jgi:hypothetical protein
MDHDIQSHLPVLEISKPLCAHRVDYIRDREACICVNFKGLILLCLNSFGVLNVDVQAQLNVPPNNVLNASSSQSFARN